MKRMIAVSTEQNTVNLIPAIQLEVNELILLETSFANEQKWSAGLVEVLEARGINVIRILLEKEEDNRIDLIAKNLLEQTEIIKEAVILNIGGGQKPQQMALWQIFNLSGRKGDLVCYSNPSTRKIEKWTKSESELIFSEENINIKVSAAEILKVFGKTIKRPGLSFYKKNCSLKVQNAKDLFKYNEFCQYFYSLSGLRTTVSNQESYTIQEIKTKLNAIKKEEILKNEIIEKLDFYTAKRNMENYKNSVLSVKNKTISYIIKNFSNQMNLEPVMINEPEFLNELKVLGYKEKSINLNFELINLLLQSYERKSPASYFEEVLTQRCKHILETTDHENFVYEAYSNIETSSGEYDILLVTVWGTLIALDAKTFDVDKKDADARLYNLIMSGGRYVEWLPVFPFDPESVSFMSSKLRNLPLTLKNIQKKFFVISDNYQSDYVYTANNEEIQMIIFDNFLKKLNLI